MCDQTEINYLDGDIVWVKLGACWWPGQVTGFHNLPEDIQVDFQKKSLIAAVKFFQEDTYEYVKNLHQIYKYNCTQKDEFIKKGLDKFRIKSKDGSSYMDKFPGDVEMAEKLTGGDPEILTSEKFCPEQKPDISALFGEKKIPKRKRDRDDMQRRSDGGGVARKITHPRFLRESDHEIRIRQQPTSLPSTPNNTTNLSSQYTCHLCNFTSSRVNVIICHMKSHRSGGLESPVSRPRIQNLLPKSTGKPSPPDSQKRKYVRKTKSLNVKGDREAESVKRKHTKQLEKTTTKKKKTDPELREKLLADWDDESDEDMDLDMSKSVDTSSTESPAAKNSEIPKSIAGVKEDDVDEGADMLKASEKLLKETEKLSSLLEDDSPSRTSRFSNNKHLDDSDMETDTSTSILGKDEKSPSPKKPKKKIASEEERRSIGSDKDDKQSRFSCFDFDEEDLPEPSIAPVRKIPRVFSEKNTSLKKEILKKFTMSQALKNEKEKEEEVEKSANSRDLPEKKEDTEKEKPVLDEILVSDKSGDEDKLPAKEALEADEKTKADVPTSSEDQDKNKTNYTDTEVEIVEIVEVEREKDDRGDRDDKQDDKEEPKIQEIDRNVSVTTPPIEMKAEVVDEKPATPMTVQKEEVHMDENEVIILSSSSLEKTDHTEKMLDDTLSEIVTTETEDETVSELADSVQGHSENSDTDGALTHGSWENAPKVKSSREDKKSKEKPVPRRRGRPRKTTPATDASGNGDTLSKNELTSKHLEHLMSRDSERKTSESDSERSYTGRRRKPNKRYLHSEIYTRSPDNRASRTDESQSETEEKLQKEQKSKPRRGKKSLGVPETRIEPLKKADDQEFEFSNRTLDITDAQAEAANVSKVMTKADKKLDPSDMSTSQDTQSDGTETEGDSTASCPLESVKKGDSNVASPVNITKLLSLGDSENESGKQVHNLHSAIEKSSQSIASIEEVVGAAVTPAVQVTEPTTDDTKNDVKIDNVKAVDKLPPKKSQIKKFELSQIDLLDACSQQVAAESARAEKMGQGSDMELDMSDSDPSVVVVSLERPAEQEERVVETPVEPETKPVILSQPPDNVVEEIVKDATIEAVEAELARITEDPPEEKPMEQKTEEQKTEEQKLVEQKPTEQKENEDPMNVSIEMESINEPAMVEPTTVETTIDVPSKEIIPETTEETILQPETVQAQPPEIITPELGTITKKDKEIDEEVPVNSFQEAFLKTLHIDKRDEKDESANASKETEIPKEIVSLPQNQTPESTVVSVVVAENTENVTAISQSQPIQTVPPLNAMTEFEGVEILVQDHIVEVESKSEVDTVGQTQVGPDFGIATIDSKEEAAKTLTLDLQKLEDTLMQTMSSPSPSSDVNVPVKKREKPRIIENVALKEPMQILKSKLLEKLPTKTSKHKLDAETPKKGDAKGPRAKIMKMDSSSPNSKSNKSPTKSGSSHFTITRKLQVLKAEEAAAAAALEKEKAAVQVQTPQIISVPAGGEKFIQQSSQSLADMELDINSMPFVLSEDVLTPESIEQMPVVISSMIPASSTSIPTSLTLTPTTQLVASNQVQYKTTSETVTTETPPTGKKKSGTPAILKNKGKAKPTITSIKTLVPPLTGGVKGLKFQSPQTGKAMPLISQKSTPGKYVIVQTSGGNQMRYCVQGKTAVQQKIAIPPGKGAGSAQIVQQGGKVVILTSAQSGQTKMLPLNISKTLSGKVQKIVNNKGQIYAPINAPGMMGSKTIIAPKSDVSSPTTSKLSAGQKIINTQGIITSKGVLTPISSSKSGLLTTLSQSILTKSGLYTPISSAQLASGKTIISGKTLMSKSGTILSPLGTQGLGTSKAILAPISHTLTGKTIINAQGLVTPKGTVLTPITGQQVKALAAKSPAKGGKVHYQAVQQKMQLPMLQKCQKIPISSSSPMQRQSSGTLKSPSAGGTIVYQNTVAGQKVTTPGGKKIVRQILQTGARSPQTTLQQTTSASPQQILQRGKSLTAPSAIQKVNVSRNTGRQTKAQQKIVVQKLHETSAASASSAMNVQARPTTSTNITKTLTQKSGSRGSGKGSRNAQQQKHLLNAALSSITGTPLASSEQTVNPPPLVSSAPLVLSSDFVKTEVEAPPKSEKKVLDIPVKENSKLEIPRTEPTPEAPKVEETKVPAQPQIMALPTESSDGTQTYVLVTIDEQGQIQPLDNNALMSLEATTQNADGTRTLYIDPSSLGEAGTLDNIVLQFDNGALPGLQTNVGESSQAIVSTESFPSSEIIQTSNQDILAAALANTDFQQEIGLPENPTSSVMTTGFTQTSLINQTILQSTIIPPTEPISSPSVLETSLTLNQPIMTPLEVPSSLPIQVETTSPSVVSTIPTSLELPITITNPNISYISAAGAAAVATVTTAEGQHIQIPGNSMPDIGEIMESSASGEIAQTEIPASTRYLVIPNLDENITIQARPVETGTDSPSASVSYAVSIPETMVLETGQVQRTPSMPIIDDGYTEDVEFTTSIGTSTEQSFTDVSVSEMLVSKAPSVSSANMVARDVVVPQEMIAVSEEIAASTSHDAAEGFPVESQNPSEATQDASVLSQEVYSSHDVPVTEELILQQQESSIPASEEVTVRNMPIVVQEEETVEEHQQISTEEQARSTLETMQIDEQSTEVMTTGMPIIEEPPCSVSSEMQVEVQSTENITIETNNSSQSNSVNLHEAEAADKRSDSLSSTNVPGHEIPGSFVEEEQAGTSSLETLTQDPSVQVLSEESVSHAENEGMVIEQAVEPMEIYPGENPETPDGGQSVEASSQAERVESAVSENVEMPMEEIIAETSQEAPSQSYEQFSLSRGTSDSAEIPTQSAAKSENSREPSQSIAYNSMEVDENIASGEPPTQSFEDSKRNEASQSYETSTEVNTNAPTQSFNEIMQCQEEGTSGADAIDDQSFPTQSYEVGKVDNLSENLESDATISQEGNIPSQSNDIGNDGIGTSSVSTNNSGLNEDETASSSYVPETPENQERDQDQESAISTSSYEIPPCEELNIASSSVIPDTSVRGEHTSIHDNGVPEIPTSSYNLNPDSSSTSHVDALPTSSYEDQVIVEQNVSTSYEVPISMPGLEENSSQNFVTESTDHRDEPTSYYAPHTEVSASYYEAVHQDSNSRLEADPQEEVTPSYYETAQDITSEASQSYFRPTPRYSSQSVSPSYYDPTPESEASQSYYSHDMERTEQSSHNVEASQSFYQESTDEIRLRQQGEATPTYTERYPVDYALENSPIERHDLVESSVPATRPTER